MNHHNPNLRMSGVRLARVRQVDWASRAGKGKGGAGNLAGLSWFCIFALVILVPIYVFSYFYLEQETQQMPVRFMFHFCICFSVFVFLYLYFEQVSIGVMEGNAIYFNFTRLFGSDAEEERRMRGDERVSRP